jgi:hypothetical protein
MVANPQNLRIPTSEEARIIGRKGGLASAAKRQKQKTLRELADMIAQMPVKNPKTRAIMEAAGFTDEQMTNDVAMLLGLQLKAQNGDSSAAKLLSELRGQYSTRVEVEPVQPTPLIDLTNTIEAEEKPQKGGKK